VNTVEWHEAFSEALKNKQNWLIESGMPLLKEKFKTYRDMYATLYRLLLQKRLVIEDPYKSNVKITDLVMPETGHLPEQKKREQFSLRLSNFDNQLEYIAAFWNFSIETLRADKIKIFIAILNFIDWKNISQTSPTTNTRLLAESIIKIRSSPSEQITGANLDTCFSDIASITKEIADFFNDFNHFNRESYKGLIRETITAFMTAAEASPDNVKLKFPQVLPGKPFVPDLIEELLQEDFSPEAETLREAALEKLAVDGVDAAEPKKLPPPRTLLIDGLHALGSTGETLQQMIPKIEINHELLRHKPCSFIQKIKLFFAILFNQKLDSDTYICQTIDPHAGPIEEKIDHANFVEELGKKTRALQTLAVGGSMDAKLEAMDDQKLYDLFDRQIRDIQRYHRLLSAIDEFFKTDPDIKDRVRGMRSDLSTVKIALSNALNKKDMYMARSADTRKRDENG
jgi:hypothetical protein